MWFLVTGSICAILDSFKMPWFLQLCLPSVCSICTHYSPFCCWVFRSVVILLGFVFFVILFVFLVLLVDSSKLMYNILLASCLERLSPLIHWPIVSWKIWHIYAKLILIFLLPLWAGLVGTGLCEAFPKCLCFTSRVSSAASHPAHRERLPQSPHWGSHSPRAHLGPATHVLHHTCGGKGSRVPLAIFHNSSPSTISNSPPSLTLPEAPWNCYVSLPIMLYAAAGKAGRRVWGWRLFFK